MACKGIFWTIGEHLYFVCDHITFYKIIKIYRFETKDIGIFLWKKWCQWKIQSQQVLQYLIYRKGYFGRSNTVLNNETLVSNR